MLCQNPSYRIAPLYDFPFAFAAIVAYIKCLQTLKFIVIFKDYSLVAVNNQASAYFARVSLFVHTILAKYPSVSLKHIVSVKNRRATAIAGVRSESLKALLAEFLATVTVFFKPSSQRFIAVSAIAGNTFPELHFGNREVKFFIIHNVHLLFIDFFDKMMYNNIALVEG
jgi:hypothetical protein